MRISRIPDIDPAAWHPPKGPGLNGVFAANSDLVVAERFWFDGQGPEDVAVDVDGNAYAGLEDGRVFRFGPLIGRAGADCGYRGQAAGNRNR